MSSTVSFNGSTYIIPATGDTGWGSNVSNYLIAIAAGCLQKTGGAFTLSAETDFGASFGLKSLYYKSRGTNVGTTGAFRLANAETGIVWRNAANNADLALTVNASNQLSFNGTPIESNSLTSAHILVGNASNIAIDVAVSGDLTLDNTGNFQIASGVIVNADINAAAAIAVTKLANGTANQLLGSNAAGNSNEFKTLTATANQVSVTQGVGTITLATPQDIGTASAVQHGSLALGGALDASSILSVTSTTKGFLPPVMTTTQKNAISSPTNGLVVYDSSLAQLYLRSGGAWTPLSTGGGSGTVGSGTANQLAYYAGTGTTVGGLTSITASQALASDANGLPVASTTTAAELVFVHGVTSAIQTQLNTKAPTAAPTFTGVFTAPGFIIDSSSRVLVGPSSTNTVGGFSPTLQLEGTSAATSRISITENINSAAGPQLMIAKTRGTSNGTYTIVQNGDFLGGLTWMGANGVDLSAQGAYILASISGTPSATSMPTKIDFATTPVGSVGSAIAFSIGPDQKTTHSGNIAFTTTSTQGIVGTTTNDSAAAGNVGEVIEGIATATNFPTTTQYGDLTSISLTAGDWLVSVNAGIANGTTTASIIFGISTTTGNSSTGLTTFVNTAGINIPTGATSIANDSVAIPSYHMKLATTTTVYLKYSATYSAGTPQGIGRITAVRIR